MAQIPVPPPFSRAKTKPHGLHIADVLGSAFEALDDRLRILEAGLRRWPFEHGSPAVMRQIISNRVLRNIQVEAVILLSGRR